MELKKTSSADLENKRKWFFLASLAIVSCAFYFVLGIRIDDGSDDDFNSDALTALFIEKEFDDSGLSVISPAEVIIEQEEEEKPVYEDFNITENKVEQTEEQILSEAEKTPEEIVSTPENDLTSSETAKTSDGSETVFTEAEVMPQFPGGISALSKFIYSNINYPEDALSKKIQGRVWCSFVVEKNGSITGLKIEKGINQILDDEVFRVLNLMPTWNPGENSGSKVRTRIYLPIVFRLS